MCKDFIWYVDDDSKNCDTEDYINEIREKSFFSIIYYHNHEMERGINRAYNRLLKWAKSEMILKLDDDDYLTPDAVETILKYADSIGDRNDFAGVAGLRGFPDGKINGGKWRHKTGFVDATNLERRKYGLTADKAEAYYTDSLKKYEPFPEISGENWTVEGTVYDRIAHAGLKIRWFNEVIYIGEYLEGGTTSVVSHSCINNFKTYTISISEFSNYKEAGVMWRFVRMCKYFEVARKKELSYSELRGNFEKTKALAQVAYMLSGMLSFVEIIFKKGKEE